MYYAFVVFGGESPDFIPKRSKQERSRESDKPQPLKHQKKSLGFDDKEIVRCSVNTVDECFTRKLQ